MPMPPDVLAAIQELLSVGTPEALMAAAVLIAMFSPGEMGSGACMMPGATISIVCQEDLKRRIDAELKSKDYYEEKYGDLDPQGKCGGGREKGKKGDNTTKNKQARQALDDAGEMLGIEIDDDLQEGFHDYITGLGLETYKQLKAAAAEFLQGRFGCGGE